MSIIKVLFIVVVTLSIAKSSPLFSARIINGTESKELVPFIARIIFQYEETDEGLVISTDCGASLIASKWVLTAKHCLLNDKTEEISKEYRIFIGNNDYRKGEVIKVIAHYFFSHENHIDHDLAMLKLENAPKNEKVTPIPVQYTDLDYAGKTVTLYGWGLTDPTDDNSDGPILRQTNVVLDSDITNDPEDTIRFNPHTTKTNSCKGDSGGPMTLLVDSVETLIGVSHVSEYENGVACQGNFSSYTKTFYPAYAAWIQETMTMYSD